MKESKLDPKARASQDTRLIILGLKWKDAVRNPNLDNKTYEQISNRNTGFKVRHNHFSEGDKYAYGSGWRIPRTAIPTLNLPPAPLPSNNGNENNKRQSSPARYGKTYGRERIRLKSDVLLKQEAKFDLNSILKSYRITRPSTVYVTDAATQTDSLDADPNVLSQINETEVVFDGRYTYILSAEKNDQGPFNFNDIMAIDTVTLSGKVFCTHPDAQRGFPAARQGHCLFQYKEIDGSVKIVISGGWNGSEKFNDLWRLDDVSMQWICITSSKVPSICQVEYTRKDE
ncbi:hypothetical protein QAD02_021825 [Eretmocerus hayati]|uniref:Uncharacterized protein n=1 Tax=Eretmocerus hayati TaxID=131215 RepID=A0ACC2PRI9_9HYME|nr:hypothetical protein QAD02_021825 [Eretmocerus hayati]